MTISITAFTPWADNWFQDTLLATHLGTSPNAYSKRNPSDRLVFTTSDASAVIQGLVYDIPQNLSAYVDGVYYASVAFTGSFTNQLQTLTLPNDGHVHTIELEEEGVSITGIGSSGCNIQIIPYAAPANRVISYGDSIEVGYNVTGRFGLGWWQLCRRAEQSTFSLLNDSYAGACFWDDNRDGTHQDAWVASLAPAIDGTSKTILIVDRMTNDFGTAGTWNSTGYGAGLLATLTKLHTAYPTLQVYLKTCLLHGAGSFYPAGEAAVNTFGETVAAYRTAGAAAIAAANTALGTSFGVLDGTAMGLLSLSSDGLHPNNAGHATLAAWAVAHWFPLFNPAPPPPRPPPKLYQVTVGGKTLTAGGKVLQFSR
jgi:lysophospholipase L1-like esterase